MAEAQKKELVAEKGGDQTGEGAAEPSKKKFIFILIFLLVGVIIGLLLLRRSEAGPPSPPPIELGEIVSLHEFLLNLDNGQSYLRVSLAVQLNKGYDKKKFDADLPIVRDAVIATLSSQTSSFVNTLQGKEALKHQIAAAINTALDPSQPVTSPSNPKVKPLHPNWDSQTGPVLMVYFTDFVTQ